jgi:hypothetical protein
VLKRGLPLRAKVFGERSENDPNELKTPCFRKASDMIITKDKTAKNMKSKSKKTQIRS